MVSTDHRNAEFYFNRDVECIRTFFRRRFHYESSIYPRFSRDGRNKEFDLDVVVAASGFTKKLKEDFEEMADEQGIRNGDEANEQSDDDDDSDAATDEEFEYSDEDDDENDNDHDNNDDDNNDAEQNYDTNAELGQVPRKERQATTASVETMLEGMVRVKIAGDSVEEVADGDQDLDTEEEEQQQQQQQLLLEHPDNHAHMPFREFAAPLDAERLVEATAQGEVLSSSSSSPPQPLPLASSTAEQNGDSLALREQEGGEDAAVSPTFTADDLRRRVQRTIKATAGRKKQLTKRNFTKGKEKRRNQDAVKDNGDFW